MAGHRPFLIDSTNEMLPDGDQPVATQLREAFEDLFLKHGVSSVPVLHTCTQPTQLRSTVEPIQRRQTLCSGQMFAELQLQASTFTAAGPSTNVAVLLACKNHPL